MTDEKKGIIDDPITGQGDFLRTVKYIPLRKSSWGELCETEWKKAETTGMETDWKLKAWELCEILDTLRIYVAEMEDRRQNAMRLANERDLLRTVLEDIANEHSDSGATDVLWLRLRQAKIFLSRLGPKRPPFGERLIDSMKRGLGELRREVTK